MPLARALQQNEKRGLKALQGRPKSRMKNRKPKTRCAAVNKKIDEGIPHRTQIGGLFVTMSWVKEVTEIVFYRLPN